MSDTLKKMKKKMLILQAASNNLMGQEEIVRFKKEVDDLRNVLQRVSRLTDILSTQMEILPEDFEDMEKDRQRYLEELQVLGQQIEEANKYTL
jgi:enolase